MAGPRRIVCLTEEPTEVLYALGQSERIVGISGFTVRPPRARREKPKVSAFTSAKIGEILALKPDFVVGFSDIQADIAAELIRAGVEVWISNHRSVAGIIDYVRRLGALVDEAAAANAYADELQRGLDEVASAAAKLPVRPRVYFEEWDEPMITLRLPLSAVFYLQIQWVIRILCSVTRSSMGLGNTLPAIGRTMRWRQGLCGPLLCTNGAGWTKAAKISLA